MKQAKKTISPDGGAEKKATAKQQSIIRAATQLFLRYGYSYTTMDAIAQKAVVTKQTVYSYYHDKDTLFVNMISELCRAHAPAQPSRKRQAFRCAFAGDRPLRSLTC